MTMGFDVGTHTLSGVADDLDEVGRALSRHRADLDAVPDAGRTSNEAAQALAALATTLAAAAEHIGSMSGTLRETVRTYERADSGVDARFRGLP